MNAAVIPINWRELVVAEALTWNGTPYHHQADIKGAGVDCAMILVRVFCGLGLAPPFDPRPYAPQWYLHRTEEKYIGWLEKYAIRIPEERTLPADIQLYRFGRCAAHGAIILDEHSMIHAYAPAGKVQIQGRRDVLSHGKIDSYWTVKP